MSIRISVIVVNRIIFRVHVANLAVKLDTNVRTCTDGRGTSPGGVCLARPAQISAHVVIARVTRVHNGRIVVVRRLVRCLSGVGNSIRGTRHNCREE